MSTDCAINLKVIKLEYNIPDTLYTDVKKKKRKTIREKFTSHTLRRQIPNIVLKKINPCTPEMLMEKLLSDIYGFGRRTPEYDNLKFKFSDSERCTSASIGSDFGDYFGMRISDLNTLSNEDLYSYILQLKNKTQQLGSLLVKRLSQRDTYKRRQNKICDILTAILKEMYDYAYYNNIEYNKASEKYRIFGSKGKFPAQYLKTPIKPWKWSRPMRAPAFFRVLNQRFSIILSKIIHWNNVLKMSSKSSNKINSNIDG